MPVVAPEYHLARCVLLSADLGSPAFGFEMLLPKLRQTREPPTNKKKTKEAIMVRLSHLGPNVSCPLPLVPNVARGKND